MALKIRLARHGAKKRPYYRIVVADSRAPRDGRYIDHIGSHNPLLAKDNLQRCVVDIEKAKEWLAKGARPTDRVARLLASVDLWKWEVGNNPNKGKPGAKALERVQERASKEEAIKQAEIDAKEAAKAAKEAAKEAQAAPAQEEKPADIPADDAKDTSDA